MQLPPIGRPGPFARPQAPVSSPAGGAPPPASSVTSRPALALTPGAPTWTAEGWSLVRTFLARLQPAGAAGPGTSFAQRVVELTNRERSLRGLPPLAGRFGLQFVAEARATDMIRRGYFAHTDPDGRDPFYHLRANGVRYWTAGENIAQGQQTPEAVVAAWMKSPGHRANILNPRFGHLGVGAVQDSRTGAITWAQIFSD